MKTSFVVLALTAFSVAFSAMAETVPAGLVDLTNPNGKVTTSNNESWPSAAKNAFDNGTAHNNNDRSICQSLKVEWVYTFDEPTLVNAYAVWAPLSTSGVYYWDTRMPKAWTFEGSSDYNPATKTGTWTVLDTETDQTGWTSHEGRFYLAPNRKAYTSYRYLTSANNGGDGYTQIDELEFFHVNQGEPELEAVSFDEKSAGVYTIRATERYSDAELSLVFTSPLADTVEIALGPLAKDETLVRDIVIADTALRTDVIYSAQVKAVNEIDTWLSKIPGKQFFGVPADVVDFAKQFTLTVPASFAGELADFPIPVKISPTLVDGFEYEDVKQDGADVIFMSPDGTVYPSECESWDPDGTSLFWVQVPSVKAGDTLVCRYGTTKLVQPVKGMWSSYAGVWHLNEATAGTTAISDASDKASNGTSHASSTVTDGVFGNARSLNLDAKNGGLVVVPKNTALDALVPSFTVSGWVKPLTLSLNWGYLFSRKTADSYASWGLQFRGSDGNSDSVGIYSNGTADNDNNRAVVNTKGKWTANAWQKYDVVYTAETVSLYINGTLVDSAKPVKPGVAANGANDFAIGGFPTTANHGTIKAAQDEVRLRNGAVSADWIADEYAFQSGTMTLAAGEVTAVDSSAVKFASVPAVTKSGASFVVSVTTAEDSGDGVLTVECQPAAGNSVVVAMSDSVEASKSYSATLAGLAADTSYTLCVKGVNAKGTETKAKATDVIYNGTLAVALGVPADESSLSKPGTVIVSRQDAFGDLVVNYALSGTAVPGTHYIAPSGTVTIPDGQTSAAIEIYPLRAQDGDHVVEVTLTSGLYSLDDEAKTVALPVKRLTTPDGYNTWIASADGNASVADNWSLGRVPQATDRILVDGRYSQASMVWDAGVNGLPTTVAEWKQDFAPGETVYEGTVTIKTVFPGKGDFAVFTVSGACVINCGTWTHPQSRTMGDKQDNAWDWLGDLKANETYRLRLDCGSLTIGAGARVDVQKMGYYASHDGSRLTTTAHGGVSSASGMPAYGNPKEPIHIGLPLHPANNYYNGKGAGAIYITVNGPAVVNGVLSADSGNTGYGTGAAGSVYLKAKSVTGAGTISAYGTGSGEGNYKGTGGRIALVTETPVDRSTFAQITAAAEWKNAQGNHATYYGGAGTVVFIDRTHPNGILVVAGKSDLTINWSNHARVTPVGTEGDWTFDAIEFGHGGRLSVPQGTTLKLPNGLDSITSTASSAEMCGLMTEGGTLDIGTKANQTMSGNWMLYAQEACALNANVTLTGGAMIGVPGYGCIMEESATLPDFPACHLSVNGNLTVDATGRIKADNTGFRKSTNNEAKGLTGYLSHGGRTAAFGKTLKLHYQGYDSIFNPSLPGCTVPYTNGQGAGQTASVLDLAVTGTLTVNGSITADATYSGAATHNNSAGPGGSIKVTAGALAGSGTISANGARNAGCACGGGGRIAIRLTDKDATFEAFEGQVVASGRYSADGNPGGSGSAGTVYLQTVAEGEGKGTIRIANLNASGYGDAKNPNTTEMASLGHGGDEIVSYKRAKYSLGYCGRAAVNADLQAASVELAETTASLDLEGHKLKVHKLTGVDGEGAIIKVKPGTYTAADLAKLGLAVIDSSADENGAHATGTIEVTGGGIAIIVK